METCIILAKSCFKNHDLSVLCHKNWDQKITKFSPELTYPAFTYLLSVFSVVLLQHIATSFLFRRSHRLFGPLHALLVERAGAVSHVVFLCFEDFFENCGFPVARFFQRVVVKLELFCRCSELLLHLVH